MTQRPNARAMQFVAVFTLALIAACAGAEESGAMQDEIPPALAHERQADGGLVLIDVRRPGEWEKTGLPAGAARATLQDDDFLAQVEAITSGNKQAEVAFICRTGKRSATARDRLEAAGYENVTSVAGGLLGRNGWRKQDLPETSLAQSRCGDGDAATTGQC